ncbi:MAG: class I SAM-dependent methyltransferase [Acidimicrobiales bacterium]
MTTTTDPTTTVDEEALGAFAEGLFGAGLQTVELTLTYVGRRLGLYDALRGAPRTPAELAGAAGIDERYAREWLEQQAMAGTLTVDDADAEPGDRRFALPEEHAIVLLDEEHPAYTGALADFLDPLVRTLDHVLEAFRTGAGVAFAEYHLHDMQAGFTRPMFANDLVATWIPGLPDIQARLDAGEPLRIADIGCGEGWASIYLAEAYPHITVDGFDLDDTSIAQARKHASERGVADRVRFEVQDVTDTAFGRTYDLVLAIEMVHDLADPVDALAAMERISRPDGAVLVIDENATERFVPDGDEIQRLLYGFSVLHCLPAGRTHEHSAATGTVMRPATFEGYAAAAGFATVTVLPIEHPFFRFYRLGR